MTYNQELVQAIISGKAKPEKRAPKPMQTEEHNLQVACCKWFRLQYPKYSRLLFAIPNGGGRSKAEAGKLKAEGVVAGVADLCLAIPRNGFAALYVEMKKSDGKQQTNQKEWQKDCEAVGNRYVVCKSLEEFINAVKSYLK